MLCKARICFSQASVSTSCPQDSYIQTESKSYSRILYIIELAKQEQLHDIQARIRSSLKEFEIKIHNTCQLSTSSYLQFNIVIFTLNYIITLHQM